MVLAAILLKDQNIRTIISTNVPYNSNLHLHTIGIMSLETLGQELRQQRQSRGISLTDIAAETRINVRFLEAMEEGKFALLPQTYVRAFLREYGAIVGMDPAEVLFRYNEARGEKPAPEPQHPGGKPLVNVSGRTVEEEQGWSDAQRKVILGLLVVAVVAVAVFLLTSTSNGSIPAATQEIPFDRVVKETEAATIRPDTGLRPGEEPSALTSLPVSDSLYLEIQTADSVWLSLTSDHRKTEQYLFGPNRRKQWVAKEQFLVSMGNAGGAVFRLNGRDIGAIGRRGGVVRNVVINAATSKQ